MKLTKLALFLILLTFFLSFYLSCSKEKSKESEDKYSLIDKIFNKPTPLPDYNMVVAEVNGVKILLKDVEERIMPAVRVYRQNYDKEPPKDFYDRNRKEAIERLIETELVAQEALKRGYVVTDEEVEKNIDLMSKTFRDNLEFQKFLEDRGISREKLFENTRKELLKKKLMKAIGEEKVKEDDPRLKEYYEINKEKYYRPERVRVRQILIKAGLGLQSDEKKKYMQRAQELLDKVKSGEDFAEVARKYSDGDSAKDGGDLGYIYRGATSPTFEQEAFKLNPGEISGIFRTKFGFHIIQVLEKKEEGIADFEEVKPDILNRFQVQEATLWVKELMEKADIKRQF